MPRICFATLGCKVNQVDTAYLGDLFAAAGYEVVPWPGPADVVVVNTCTVTATADRQSRQRVNRARRENPDAVVVVTGCAPLSGGGRPDAFAVADLITGNREKEDLLLLVEGLRGRRPQRVLAPMSEAASVPGAGAHPLRERTRAFLKVQDGCPAACTYCIVPTVRGPSRSVAVAPIVDAVAKLVAHGTREVVLTGIHLGFFGRDLATPTPLHELCVAILADTDLPRLRLSSLEPLEVAPELIALLADQPRLCPHLHLPLQSGSDRILRAMNRPYTVAQFAAVVDRVRDAVPNVTIGADVLVGFPGEDDLAFRETVETLGRLALPHLHVFPYSDRPDTVAAALAGKVPRGVARERAAQIRELGREHRLTHLRAQIGRELRVLLEGDASHGLSRNYLPVAFGGAVADAAEVTARITGVDERELALLGERV